MIRDALDAALSDTQAEAGARLARRQEIERPDVILVVLDELSCRFLTGPILAAMQALGVEIPILAGLMDSQVQGYCAYPSCAPARASMLTALSVQHHGQFHNGLPLLESNECWPAWFRAAGYTTGSFGKLHTNGTEEDGHFGFDRLLSAKSPDWGAVQSAAVAAGGGEGFAGNYYDETDDPLFTEMEGFTGRGMRSKVRTDDQACADTVMVDTALDWVTAQRALGLPVLAHISLLKPHYPFNVPSQFYNLVDPGEVDLSLLHPREAAGVDVVDDYLFAERNMVNAQEEHYRLYVARYMGTIAYVESLLKHIIEDVVTLDTLLCIMGDHGEYAGDRGLWFKTGMREESIRIPISFQWEAVKDEAAPFVYPGLVSGMDIGPTLAGLAGVPVPSGLDGVDLSVPLLLEEPGMGRQSLYVCAWVTTPTDPAARQEAFIVPNGPNYTKSLRYYNNGSAHGEQFLLVEVEGLDEVSRVDDLTSERWFNQQRVPLGGRAR
jgi:arylsulfatase A-like enzyme